MYKITGFRGRPAPLRVKGAVAIEFALIFLVLFALFYAIVSYALPLLMMQAFHAAAADGARKAVSVILEPEDTYVERVRVLAEEEASDRIAWLMPLSGDRIDVNTGFSNGVLEVTVEYPDYSANPPIPALGKIPYFNQPFPPLPARLHSQASIRL